jgi:prefoldin alpha subunit
MQEIQKKIVQFQLLRANLQMIEEKERELGENLLELRETLEALKELESVKADSEIMIHIGSGNYVGGKILDTQRVLVNIGAGVMVSKERKEAEKLIKDRIEEIEKLVERFENEKRKIGEELERLREEIERLSEKSQ